MTPPSTVALVLGSGGARGYAHIGAIQVLTERGLRVATVAGSSMGALIGGLHAAGKLEEYADWAVDLSQLDVVRLLDLSLSAPGAIRAAKVVARVRELLDGARIEDLPIPYTAVATDLGARREVWFQEGPVDVAIRASIAIPGVITPVVLNGRLLADGGILNPLPIAPTTSVAADLTVAVSLAGTTGRTLDGPEMVTAEPGPMDEWIDRFRRSAAHLFDRDSVRSMMARFGGRHDDQALDGVHPEIHSGDRPAVNAPGPGPAITAGQGPVSPPGEPVEPVEVPTADEGEPFEPLPAGLSKLDMMTRSLEAMQSVLVRYRLASYPPDVLVEIPKDACRSVDFHRAAEMIEIGRALTVDALDRAGLGVSTAPAAPDP